MPLSQHAYAAGSDDAKVAFFGELYNKYIKGDVGPLLAGAAMQPPHEAAIAGGVGQLLDTPPGGSKILRSLGVAGGAVAGSALIMPVANIVAKAVMATSGLNPEGAGAVLLRGLMGIPPSLGVSYAARKGRDAAEHVEKFLKSKGTRIP